MTLKDVLITVIAVSVVVSALMSVIIEVITTRIFWRRFCKMLSTPNHETDTCVHGYKLGETCAVCGGYGGRKS